jgi:hypothetical protein
LYLTSSGAWSSTKQVCITTTDSSSPFPQTGITCLNANQTALDFYITGWSVNNVNPPITEVSTSPVLAKGGTYNGWKADAWAAPPWTDDGTQWVMAPNPWSIANGQWATTFFTCPYSGGMQTWTYISGSILTPANFGVAGDYIIGDGGLIWWNNAYYMSYVHGPSGGPWYIGIAKTTNLAGGPSAWTKINTTLISNGADNNLAINPSTGYLELWWMNPATSPRTIYMHNSPDGTTWTAQGLQYTAPSFDFGGDFGAPSVTYLTYPLPGMPVGTRIMTNDLSPISSGYRYSMMSYSVDAGTDWTFAGIINGLNPNASWEDAQTFDGRIGLADIGDGRGKILRLIYAGSDTNSPTDNTDSSIGLGTLVSLPDNLQLGVGIR